MRPKGFGTALYIYSLVGYPKRVRIIYNSWVIIHNSGRIIMLIKNTLAIPHYVTSDRHFNPG